MFAVCRWASLRLCDYRCYLLQWRQPMTIISVYCFKLRTRCTCPKHAVHFQWFFTGCFFHMNSKLWRLCIVYITLIIMFLRSCSYLARFSTTVFVKMSGHCECLWMQSIRRIKCLTSTVLLWPSDLWLQVAKIWAKTFAVFDISIPITREILKFVNFLDVWCFICMCLLVKRRRLVKLLRKDCLG